MPPSPALGLCLPEQAVQSFEAGLLFFFLCFFYFPGCARGEVVPAHSTSASPDPCCCQQRGKLAARSKSSDQLQACGKACGKFWGSRNGGIQSPPRLPWLRGSMVADFIPAGVS